MERECQFPDRLNIDVSSRRHRQRRWLTSDRCQHYFLDAMYAPVALRFHTYRLEAGISGQDSVNQGLEYPAMLEWIEAGKRESERMAAFEDWAGRRLLLGKLQS